MPETDLPRAKEKGVQILKYNHPCRDRVPSSHLPALGSVGPSGAPKRLRGGHLPGTLGQLGGGSPKAPPTRSRPSGPEGPPTPDRCTVTVTKPPLRDMETPPHRISDGDPKPSQMPEQLPHRDTHRETAPQHHTQPGWGPTASPPSEMRAVAPEWMSQLWVTAGLPV